MVLLSEITTHVSSLCKLHCRRVHAQCIINNDFKLIIMANKRKYFSVAQVIKILTDNADLGEELTSGAANQAGK